MSEEEGACKCPWCPFESNAGRCSKSNVNRHVRYYAKMPENKRQGHPGLDDDKYLLFARGRHFWNGANSSEERVERIVRSKRNYDIKRKYNRRREEEDVIYKAIEKLR